MRKPLYPRHFDRWLFGACVAGSLFHATLQAASRPGLVDAEPLKIEVSEAAAPVIGAKEAACAMDEAGRVLVVWVDAEKREIQAKRSAGMLSEWSPAVRVAKLAGNGVAGAENLGVQAGGGGRWIVHWQEKCDSGLSKAHGVETRDGGATWGEPAVIGPEAGFSGTLVVASGAVGKGPWRVAWTEMQEAEKSARSTLMAGYWPMTASVGKTAEKAAVNAAARGGMTAVVFRDGTFLLSYRGYNDDGAVDPWQVAQRDGKWQEAVRIGREGWLDTPPEMPGAHLTGAGSHAGAAWYTASDEEPRVLAAVSPDAGMRWTQSQRADLRFPTGPVAGLMRKDGTHLVVWTESPGDDESMPGGVWLRRYNSGGGTVPPTRVVGWKEVDRSLGLRLCEPWGRGVAEGGGVLLAHAAPGGGLRFKWLKLPSKEVLDEIDRNCGCGAKAVGDEGVAVKGRILKVDTREGRVLIGHEAVPGVLASGQLWVRVPQAVAAALKEGRGFLGKLDEREDGWWLRGVSMFATMP